MAGYLAMLNPLYFAILAAVALHFVWQIAFLRQNDPADCLFKFKANALIGWLLLAAIAAGHLALR